MKQVLKTLLFLVGGVVGGYLLLVLVFCIPTGRIHNHVLESAASFSGEYGFLIQDNITTRTDDFTDALMLLTAENNSGSNPFMGSIYAYHLAREGTAPHEVISDTDNSENYSAQYSRYWHGYLLYLKPLLVLFNYGQIQVLISFAVIGLVVGVIYLLQKKKMNKYIIPYAITVALMFPAAISLSLQFIAVFAIFNLAMMFILLFFDKILKTKNFFYLFLTIGMLTCYFDLLTYPVVSLGIPLVVWLMMLNKEKALSFKRNLSQIFLGSAGWALGYFGIWVGKWAIGSLITGENLFGAALSAAEERSSTTTAVEEIPRTLPITEAFDVVFTSPVVSLLVILLVIAIVLWLMKKIKINKEKAVANLWMLVVALIPLVWYVVLVNHSAWHMFFTYRTMSVLIFAVGCYLISMMKKTEKIKKRKEQDG